MAPPVERLRTDGCGQGGPGRVQVDLSLHTTLCTLYRTMAQRPLGVPSGGHGTDLEAPARHGTLVVSLRIPDVHSSPGSLRGGSGLGCEV